MGRTPEHYPTQFYFQLGGREPHFVSVAGLKERIALYFLSQNGHEYKAITSDPSQPNQTKREPHINRLLHPHCVFIKTISRNVLASCLIPFLANQPIHMHRNMQWVHVFVLRELLRNTK